MSSRIYDLNSNNKFYKPTVDPFNAVPASLDMTNFISKQITAANTVGGQIDVADCRTLMARSRSSSLKLKIPCLALR